MRLHLSLKAEKMLPHTIRHSSASSCPATVSKLHLLTDRKLLKVSLKFATVTAAEQNSMMLRNMPHRKAIIRYLKTLTESNGIPLRVNLLLKESLYTKTVSPFMKKTVRMLKPFRLTVFAIKQLLHALANPVN